MHLFVYYEVVRQDVGGAAALVRALQAELAADASSIRLMRRADAGAAETWMEVYEAVSPRFEARMAALVEGLGLARLAGPRHVERFVDFDDRAVDGTTATCA